MPSFVIFLCLFILFFFSISAKSESEPEPKLVGNYPYPEGIETKF